jgi:hypothetical protein
VLEQSCSESAAQAFLLGPVSADPRVLREVIGVQIMAASEFPGRREFETAATPVAAPGTATSALRLAVSGLNAAERDMLVSILRVLEQRSARPWRLCQDSTADLYLHTRAASVEPCQSEIVGLLVREGEAAANPDAIALHVPFRVMSVLDVLDEAAERLLRRRVPPVPTEATHAHAADDDKALASALARIVERRLEQNLRIRIVGFGALYICPSARVYCIDFGHDRLRAALEEHRYVMTTLAQAAPELVAQLPNARPIDEVLWQVGLLTAWERPGLDALRFRMRRWPDLARLPHRADHIALCATLAARASTRAELATATGASAADVTHFLHACELCGLIQSEPDTLPPKTLAMTAPNGLGGLFDRLRRRLGF